MRLVVCRPFWYVYVFLCRFVFVVRVLCCLQLGIVLAFALACVVAVGVACDWLYYVCGLLFEVASFSVCMVESFGLWLRL